MASPSPPDPEPPTGPLPAFPLSPPIPAWTGRHRRFGRGRFAVTVRLETRRDRVVAVLLALQLLASVVALGWMGKQGRAIHRLHRGVGDTVFLASDGTPWFRLDPHRRDVPLAEISPHLRNAVVAVEDHRFRRHPGIDPIGFGRAMFRNLRAGGLREGGSTITQQLARTLFLTNNRTFGRKAKEAVIAVMLEMQLTKEQILELYLNRVYVGAGVYGMEAMSRQLYDKPAKNLTIAEAALLAGLLKSPSALSPWSNLEGALARSDVVLGRMRAEGYITEAEERAARRAKLRITSRPRLADSGSGYAKEYLRQAFRDQFGGDHPPEWTVHTTFQPAVQAAAERAVASGLRTLGRANLQAALVAIDPETGAILALVGGRDFNDAPYNRAVRSRRQPGSAFKPFVYAAAMEKGLSPVSVLDHLTEVKVSGKQEWSPRNSSGVSPDESTLREALLESNNQAAVALQQKIGSGAVLSLARGLGLEDLPDVPSLALGSGLVTPLDLTAAFAVFPNGGLAVRPHGMLRVDDADGGVAWRFGGETTRVLSEEAAFQTLSMLRDVVDYGTGSAARSMGVGFPVGGKTGTTNEFKDAWFVGFSSAVVVGVWVGFDQPEPIGTQAYAARVALPIWADFMRRTTRPLPPRPFRPPDGLRTRELCRVSYLRPVEDCPTYPEYFKEGDAEPTQLCRIHEGSLKQEARKVLEGFLDGLRRRIGRIFR
jgi:penicillin-binding protein 1A